MLKALFVFERRQSELLPRLLEFLFNSKRGLNGSGKDVLELIKKENPKLAFFEFENPSNIEGSLDKFLANLDEDIQLNYSLIKISPANFFIIRIIYDGISGLTRHWFGHHRKGGGINEAFGKR